MVFVTPFTSSPAMPITARRACTPASDSAWARASSQLRTTAAMSAIAPECISLRSWCLRPTPMISISSPLTRASSALTYSVPISRPTRHSLALLSARVRNRSKTIIISIIYHIHACLLALNGDYWRIYDEMVHFASSTASVVIEKHCRKIIQW